MPRREMILLDGTSLPGHQSNPYVVTRPVCVVSLYRMDIWSLDPMTERLLSGTSRMGKRPRLYVGIHRMCNV